MGSAETREALGPVRLQLNALVRIGDGLGELAERSVAGGAVRVVHVLGRVELDRQRKGGDGLGVLVRLEKCVTAVLGLNCLALVIGHGL